MKQANFWVLELFHGPTFAFKDVALQFLGNVFEFFLQRGNIQESITILGATSGDTGSAAIHGLRGKTNVNCFIMYPLGKVTEIQEKQMTTIPDENVHCISIEVCEVFKLLSLDVSSLHYPLLNFSDFRETSMMPRQLLKQHLQMLTFVTK